MYVMKLKPKLKPSEYWELDSLSIKEICEKYKDKITEIIPGKYPVIVMDTCRIKYTGRMSDYYEWSDE